MAPLDPTVVTGPATVVFPFIVGARPRATTIAPLGLGIYPAFDISHVFRGGPGGGAVTPAAPGAVWPRIRSTPSSITP